MNLEKWKQPSFSYLTDVYFDFNALAALPFLLKKHDMQRPLVITDAGLVKLGMVQKLALDTPVVFDGVETNPTERCALAALGQYREADCDSILAVGGGSPIDLAKCVALLVHHAQPLKQYTIRAGGIPKITPQMPPFIAIPTTSGSGSEVGRAALLTLNNGEKLGFLSPHLLPQAVLADPDLTLKMPPNLTAGTGMDALSHCVETYCSTKDNPVADAMALDGLARGYHFIRKAVSNGEDREARKEMMLCSILAGLAFQKSLGLVHSLSHPLGALTEKRLHHGTLNALFLPHVLRFNKDFIERKLKRMAEVMGLSSSELVAEAFEKLNQDIGMPVRLGEMGLHENDLSGLAEKAFKDHCTPTNPRPVSVEDCEALYSLAL